MALTEWNFGGVLFDPLVRTLAISLLLSLAIRVATGRRLFAKVFSNPPLAEAALFVCLTGLVLTL
jgi:hypothetical protein